MNKTNRFHFTQACIGDLPAAAPGKRDTYYDDVSRGLCVLVTTRGVKSFYVVRKFKGKTERVHLGRYPDTTVKLAREHAGQINAQFDAGHNRNEQKRRERQELTLGELQSVYMKNHANVRNRRPEQQEQHFRWYLMAWKGRKLSDISKMDVQTWHAQLGERKSHRSANVALTHLRALYNRAIEWDLFSGVNPTSGTRKFKEKSRDRFLLPGELRRFLEALKDEPTEVMRDFFLVLLLTGARKGNALTMRWKDLHLDSGVWVIPDTKSGDSHTLPLSPQVISVLVARQKMQETDAQWVFPGSGESGHMKDPKRAWINLLRRAEIKGFRMHDLRRTHASYMAGNGVNHFVISRALGHKSLETTAIYARLDLDPIRAAATTAADVMLQGVSGLLPEAEFQESDNDEHGQVRSS